MTQIDIYRHCFCGSEANFEGHCLVNGKIWFSRLVSTAKKHQSNKKIETHKVRHLWCTVYQNHVVQRGPFLPILYYAIFVLCDHSLVGRRLWEISLIERSFLKEGGCFNVDFITVTIYNYIHRYIVLAIIQ